MLRIYIHLYFLLSKSIHQCDHYRLYMEQNQEVPGPSKGVDVQSAGSKDSSQSGHAAFINTQSHVHVTLSKNIYSYLCLALKRYQEVTQHKKDSHKSLHPDIYRDLNPLAISIHKK